jgi:site-specific recombinase XerD
MANDALIPVNNLQHKVVAPRTRDPQTSLLALAEQYFRTQVAGQADGTVDAKQRDLACFITFYTQLYGHDDRREWYKAVTEAFLKAMARGQVPRPSKRGEAKPQRLSQSTIARTYATVRHFARWIHKHTAPFPLGCPTDGVKAPEEEEPKWKGLSRLEQLRLLTAAQTLRVRKTHGTHQGVRDHALVATLLGTGLRISELLGMDLVQYTGRGFANVLRKGGHVQKFLPIQKAHRDILDEWLTARYVSGPPLHYPQRPTARPHPGVRDPATPRPAGQRPSSPGRAPPGFPARPAAYAAPESGQREGGALCHGAVRPPQRPVYLALRQARCTEPRRGLG